MYGSVVCSYGCLGLLGHVYSIRYRYTAIHNAHLQVPLSSHT